MALRDPVTQLPTEALFMDRLSQALALARRKHTHIGVIQLVIEGGDLEGDQELLTSLARRIEAQLRTSDTVSRVGGHDFTVLLNDVDSRLAARAVADELIMAISRPIESRGRGVALQARYGMSLFPEEAKDEQQLLATAAEALDRARS